MFVFWEPKRTSTAIQPSDSDVEVHVKEALHHGRSARKPLSAAFPETGWKKKKKKNPTSHHPACPALKVFLRETTVVQVIRRVT